LQQFLIFPDFLLTFTKNIFPWLFPDFPWPIKFPDFFQFSLTCSHPGFTATIVQLSLQKSPRIWRTTFPCSGSGNERLKRRLQKKPSSS